MQKINCEVNNCSHNRSGICYSNLVDIGGIQASSECGTCCGSFLNRKLYSDLTSNTNSNGACDALVCKANSCTYNCNSACTLSSIHVGGNDPQIYAETKCESFECK